MSQNGRQDRWATRFGLIMAMAGNAVGLGNFLRFPGKAAPYGGAFMVPYFLALLLMGIPLMWIEWTIGRHGGGYGHGSTPGMFHRLWKHPVSKYLGIFGVLLPAIIGIYYIYIESWSLGYAWQTAIGAYWGQTSHDEMGRVFESYLGLGGGRYSFSAMAYLFFVITFAVNILVFARGIEKGIEVVAKYAMPTLLVLGVILAVRVITLPPGEGSVSDGLARIWVIDWGMLSNANMWIDAAGQVFFTLSLGFGMIHTYASVLRKDEDITLNGLATCATNEFVEVILGGTIVIPAAVVFFGVQQSKHLITGSFADMGFQTLPVIFQQMFGGRLFGTMWFVLLFLAGLTSSVAMFTPLLLFLKDELNLDHKKAVVVIGAIVFVLMQPVILFFHRDIVDELDYWAGTIFLAVFATIEVVVFSWVFGMDKGWQEMHLGADLRIPRIFFYIMRFVTPVFAIGLLVWWTAHGFLDALLMKGVDPANKPYLWLARAIIAGGFILLAWGVSHAWRTHPKFFESADEEEAP
ncbi:MAG: sodium-dependent transporter [Candidatus Hydrogenedentes bacterium]|nr:sodium-dependent transporter [Candidatus Hydrogenedentota bacterium]